MAQVGLTRGVGGQVKVVSSAMSHRCVSRQVLGQEGSVLRLACGFVRAGFQGQVEFVQQRVLVGSGSSVKLVSGCKDVSLWG